MVYYLETNALYNINKIPDSILENSFYSAFGLTELIGGLNSDEFVKRKNLLFSILNSPAAFYSYFPEDVIWAGFSYFQNKENLKNRYVISRKKGEALMSLAQEIKNTDSYEEFISITTIKPREYAFRYFQNLDADYSDNFIKSTIEGNKEITNILKKAKEEPEKIDFNNETYKIQSRKDFENFIKELPILNKTACINAYAYHAMLSLCDRIDEATNEAIHDSYNGSVEIFFEVYSNYTAEKMITGSPPKRNDVQDLLHLSYLRNGNEMLIISEDKIFKKYIPEKVKSINEILTSDNK